MQALERFASELGLAFQIVDDILDVEGASAELGKTAGKDAAAGKPTYPALYGLDASRKLASDCVVRDAHRLLGSDCVDRWTNVLLRLGLRGQLAAIAHWVIGRTH